MCCSAQEVTYEEVDVTLNVLSRTEPSKTRKNFTSAVTRPRFETDSFQSQTSENVSHTGEKRNTPKTLLRKPEENLK